MAPLHGYFFDRGGQTHYEDHRLVQRGGGSMEEGLKDGDSLTLELRVVVNGDHTMLRDHLKDASNSLFSNETATGRYSFHRPVVVLVAMFTPCTPHLGTSLALVPDVLPYNHNLDTVSAGVVFVVGGGIYIEYKTKNILHQQCQ